MEESCARAVDCQDVFTFGTMTMGYRGLGGAQFCLRSLHHVPVSGLWWRFGPGPARERVERLAMVGPGILTQCVARSTGHRAMPATGVFCWVRRMPGEGGALGEGRWDEYDRTRPGPRRTRSGPCPMLACGLRQVPLSLVVQVEVIKSALLVVVAR